MRLNPESIARASSRHPWRTIGVWVAILVGSMALISGGLFTDALTNGIDFTNTPESKEAAELVQDRLRGGDEEPDTELVLVVSETATAEDPAFQDYVGALQSEIDSLDDSVVTSVGSYLTEDGPVSEEGHAALLPVLMTSTDEDVLSDDAKTVESAVRSVEAPEGFETYFAGPASVFNEFQEVIEEDIQKGESIGVLVALIVLVVVLGAVVAGIIPILLAAFAIVGAMGLTALVGTVFSFSFFVQNMITMIGLAVGIDYSIVRHRPIPGGTSTRSRQARGDRPLGRHGEPGGVLQRDDGRPRLARHPHRPDDDLPSPRGWSDLRRPGGGRGVDDAPSRRPRSDGRQDQRAQGAEEGRQGRGGHGLLGSGSRIVMRRPVISLVLGAGFMILLALPYFSIHTGTSGVSTLPDDIEAKQAFILLEENFAGGLAEPAQIVIDGDIASPEIQAAVSDLAGDDGRRRSLRVGWASSR